MFSDRDDFEDALDFIAWYMVKTKNTNGVPLHDAYGQYLNYHEGWQGYRNGSYKSKSWLLKTARSVAQSSEKYKSQLLRCQLCSFSSGLMAYLCYAAFLFGPFGPEEKRAYLRTAGLALFAVAFSRRQRLVPLERLGAALAAA